jgi:hypothetical protein
MRAMNDDDDPRLPMLIQAYRAAVPLSTRLFTTYETTIGAATMAKAFLAMYDVMKAIERAKSPTSRSEKPPEGF